MIFRKNRRRLDLQRRRKRHRILWLSLMALLGIYLGLHLLLGERGFFKYLSVARTHQALRDEIRQLEKQNEQLRQQARKLKNDPEQIEAIAREDLGLAKKGELIYLFKRDEEQ